MLPTLRLGRHPRFSQQLRLLHFQIMPSPKVGEKRELTALFSTPIVDKKRRSHSPRSFSENLQSDETRAQKNGMAQSTQKRQNKAAKKRRKKLIDIEPCSHDDVHWREVISLLGQDAVDAAMKEEMELEAPFELHEELELEISRLSSHGETFQSDRIRWN